MKLKPNQFKLTDGRIVTAYEKTFPGMAGEPMTVLQFEDENGNGVNTVDVLNMVAHTTEMAILEWISDLSDENYDSAVAFCI